MRHQRIPDSIRREIYRQYKEENKRAVEIAEKYHVSVQVIFRIIRELEGKPNWKRKPLNVKNTTNKDFLLTQYNTVEHLYDERYKIYNNR